MSCPDIGDKYSVFRQLEQPADKKPVGKKYIYVSHIHDSYNLTLLDRRHMLGSVMVPVSTWLDLSNNITSSLEILFGIHIGVSYLMGMIIYPSGHHSAPLPLFYVHTVAYFGSLWCWYQRVSRPCFIRAVCDGDSSYKSSKWCFVVTFPWRCQARSS